MSSPDNVQEEIQNELRRLTLSCAVRRSELTSTAHKTSKRKKLLSTLAGVLALLSAGSIVTVSAKLLGQNMHELFGAGIAFISGAISLISNSYYSDTEVVARFEGSSKYLALRDSVYLLAVDLRAGMEVELERIGELKKQYADLDFAYGRYCRIDEDEVLSLLSAEWYQSMRGRGREGVQYRASEEGIEALTRVGYAADAAFDDLDLLQKYLRL